MENWCIVLVVLSAYIWVQSDAQNNTVPLECIVCNENMTLVNGTCVCLPTFIPTPNYSGLACNCPEYSYRENMTCVCSLGFILINGTCGCPAGQSLINGTCQPITSCGCPEYEYYEYSMRKCRCITGYTRNARTFKCEPYCADCDLNEEFNSELQICICASGYRRENQYANCTRI